MASIQSTNVPLELSFNGGVDWLVLVCLTQYNIPVDKPVNVVETFCGPETGLGSTTFNPTGTAVAKLDPDTNQVTLQQMLTTLEAETLIKFRVRYPGTGSIGNAIFMSGDCYVTNIDGQFVAGQTVQFNFTLTGNGKLDTTP